ncbi:probable polyamine oxidase 5 [Macadamia integrifolia]|uniref:probable polyamine oxidase 5 n=1 Tax=Macadamia integrifolia TaxID=60698 RepID=UPI001C4ED3C3|nr:probable polyamine oxidase 5 [Macadamia integrifolia]
MFVKPATMVAKKPRIVIIGAGMAGVTAAHKLYSATAATELFELCVVEGGDRIGGRIHTSEFGGDQIEMGATWIHGIIGSPIHKIAQEIHVLESDQPWERMDGFSEDTVTVAEGGFQLHPSIIEPISTLYRNMMEFAQGELSEEEEATENSSNGGFDVDYHAISAQALEMSSHKKGLGIGTFLRRALEAYWVSVKQRDDVSGYGSWSTKQLQEAIFAMHESTERTYTSAADLSTLDFSAENEYREFPGEQITIAKGYLSIVEWLASALPTGLIQLGRKVKRIEWQPEGVVRSLEMQSNGGCSSNRPVRLCFEDGSEMVADHVIVTVSLGVLKAGIREKSGMFNPPLPSFKTEAISRLGFGVVNKLFLQFGRESENLETFPFLEMVFHRADSETRHQKIPWWMRKTASLCPIYKNSNVVLSWFAGEEALELESLKEDEILNGVTTTVSNFFSDPEPKTSNGCVSYCNHSHGKEIKFTKALRSQWGSNPLFMGSYSYVAVGSSGDDLDLMAEPLPKNSNSDTVEGTSPLPLQILFAGEATHRTHYSTTHGAYFSGLREANRILQHYCCGGALGSLAPLEQ